MDLSGGAGAAVMDEYDSVTPTEKQRQDFMQRANSGPKSRRNTQSNYMPVEIGVMPPPEQRASYMNQSAIDAQRRASVSSGGRWVGWGGGLEPHLQSPVSRSLTFSSSPLPLLLLLLLPPSPHQPSSPPFPSRKKKEPELYVNSEVLRK